jgi:glycosyltransferase involved in cell wall biosynthesis
MNVNFVFGNLNSCGGGERLTLITMQALMKMGEGPFDLTTFQKPQISRLVNTYGRSTASVLKNIKQTHIINILEELKKRKKNISYHTTNYDIIINTHGNVIPYYDPSFSKHNAITYCHFPSAKYYIESKSMVYLRKDLNAKLTSNIFAKDNSYKSEGTGSTAFGNDGKRELFEILKEAYFNMMKNSTVITNSEFSRKAIFDAFGIDDISVISPPVDVNFFRNSALNSSERKDLILVVSRIDPRKQVYRALRLAKILKESNIGKGMKIVGNLYPYNFNYYSRLKNIVKASDLNDYVAFEINASVDKLLSIMRKAKIYFHPMVGEHFGMSVVEAMAAGLVPIVPHIGGPTEFVSKNYHFDTLEEAAHIISSAFHLSYNKRAEISDSVNKFSTTNYISAFQNLFNELISHKQ